MAKELYIYSPIYDYTVEVANKQLSDVKDSEDLTIRLNSPGGETSAGFSFLSKLSERKTKTNAIIDGNAKSMAAYILAFIDRVVSNDTSEIMFHKAAYPGWYKPNAQEIESLDRTNAIFEEKMSLKVAGKPGAVEFLSKLFEKDKRNNVELTPGQALELGIVQEVRKLEPKAFYGQQICAMYEEEKPEKESGEINNSINIKIPKMDLIKLKAEHPALYAEVFGLGETSGITKEKERAEAWAVFMDIDPAKVKIGIDGGKLPSAKDMAEFQLAAISGAKLKAIEDENAEETNTDTTAKTAEQLEAEKDEAELKAHFGEIKKY